ncbi:MAG: UrcA family protein [Henriciella sp.]|nr:UrcA family protein [Henriciella sp.]
MKFSQTLIAAGAAITLATAPAMAGDEHEKKTIKIDVSAYDLNTEAGVDAVYSQIRAAAKRVCRLPGRPTVGEIVARNDCMDEAIVNAIKGLDSPAVRQAFAAKARKSIG